MQLRLNPSFLLGLFVLSGCHSPQQAKFNQGKGVGSELTLVVPFSEPRNHQWFGESERGLIVAEAFTIWAEKNADPNFPAGESVEEAFRAIRDWKKEKILLDDWQKITAELGIKYILVGQIDDLTLTKPNVIGLLEPSVKASYRVIDVQRKKVVFQRSSFTVEYATPNERESQVPDFGSDSGSAEKRLLTKLGQQIGKDLFGYQQE